MKKENPKGPIFIARGDGLGWTLNFDRPEGYIVLVIILVIFVLGVLWGMGVVKF